MKLNRVRLTGSGHLNINQQCCMLGDALVKSSYQNHPREAECPPLVRTLCCLGESTRNRYSATSFIEKDSTLTADTHGERHEPSIPYGPFPSVYVCVKEQVIEVRTLLMS